MKELVAKSDLFDQMAINVPSEKVSQYSFSDRLDGYFEVYTHSYAKGTGYLVQTPFDHILFCDYQSFLDHQLLDRTRALESTLFPDRIRSTYENAFEEFTLHRGHRGITLRVHSDHPSILAIRLLLPENPPEFSATSEQIVDRSGETFRTRGPQTELVLHLSFDATDPTTGYLQTKRDLKDILGRSLLVTEDETYDQANRWALHAGDSLVVDGGKGVWAGLPWFRDFWGRDTFISLPGLFLVTGRFEEAKTVIRRFAEMQDPITGRIPNRVTGQEIIYNTADGTPWFIRSIYETLRYTGDRTFAREIWPAVRTAIEGEWTQHGDENGFFTHADADTWMDARIDGTLPWSARGNRAIEIQALWYVALRIGVELAQLNGAVDDGKRWGAIADSLQANFVRYFYHPELQRFADRLRPDDSQDLKIRPNQLMVLSLPFRDRLLASEHEAVILRDSISNLLFPHGLASLAPEDPYFHPIHEDWDHYHKDAAYHNGTVWGWNAGFATTALTRFGYGDLAYRLAQNLAHQILEIGCLGTMSELMDAIRPNPSGTWSQAWSVAEFTRNAYQDFAGIRPNLLDEEIEFAPALPRFKGEFPLASGQLSVDYDGDLVDITSKGLPELTLTYIQIVDHHRYRFQMPLSGHLSFRILAPGRIEMSGQLLEGTEEFDCYHDVIGALSFREPLRADWSAANTRDYLKGIIEKGLFR